VVVDFELRKVIPSLHDLLVFSMHLLLFSVPRWRNVSLSVAFPGLGLPSILLETCVKIKTWWGLPSTTLSTVNFDFAGDVHQSAVFCYNRLTFRFCHFAGDVLRNIDSALLGNAFWQITKTMFCLRRLLIFQDQAHGKEEDLGLSLALTLPGLNS